MKKNKYLYRFLLLFCTIILVNNCYSQWQSINSGLQDDLVDGCFTSDSVGFIVRLNGTILKTSDSGSTWTVNANLSGVFTSISKVNQDTIYAGGNKLYRSDDGGISWNLIISFNDTISDLRFFDSKTGLMIAPDLDSCYNGYYTVTPSYRVYKTNDYGSTWQYQFRQAIESSRFTYNNDSSTIIPRTEYTVVHQCAGPVFNNSLRTDDKGHTWYNVHGESSAHYSSINDSVVFSFSTYYTNEFFYSRDKGKSALRFATSYNGGIINQIEFINEIDGYLLTSNNIYGSRSKGINWTHEHTSTNGLNFLFKNVQGTLVCIGDSGLILKKSHTSSLAAEPVYRFQTNRSALDFGLVHINNSSTHSVQLINSGTRALQLSLSSSSDFNLSLSDSNFLDSLSLSLPSYRDTLLNIKFNPSQSIAYNYNLLIRSDSIPDLLIPLNGEGYFGLADTIRGDTLICVDTLNIASDIFIPDSVEVIVCAGTYVNFMGEYAIEVNGILQMLGDSANMISFNTIHSTVDWNGIRLNSSNNVDTSIFNYCNFDTDCSTSIISMNSGKVKVDHSYFRNRAFTYPDGAIAIETKGSAKLIVSNSTIAYNDGHAILVDNADSTYIINNVIYNTRDEAAIRVNSAQETFIIGNHLYNNDFEAINGEAPLYIKGNEINDNGGGIRIDAAEMKVTIEDNIIYNNISPNIGGIFILNSAELLLRQNLIFNNESQRFDGGGLLLNLTDSTSKYIVNNTIANNKVRSAHRGNNIFFYTAIDSTLDLNMLNNIIYSSGYFDKSVQWQNIEGQNIAYNCINQPGIELLGITNVNSDPGISNPTTMGNIGSYDWTLDSMSICIDAGHPTETSLLLPLDIAGNPRIVDGRVDLGAFEYVAPSAISELSTESYTIYPNPVNDLLHISLKDIGQCEIILYDATSKAVLENSIVNSTTLDLRDLRPGIYFFRIKNKKSLIGQGKILKY